MGSKLTRKMELFCTEYIIDLNATQSAIRAGYSQKTARRIASENLSKPVIQDKIQSLMATRAKESKLSASYVLNRLVEIDSLDVLDILNGNGSLKEIKDWPKSWRTSITGLDINEMTGGSDIAVIAKKIKWPDKLKNIELLGRHINIKAWDGEPEKDGVKPVKIFVGVVDAS